MGGKDSKILGGPSKPFVGSLDRTGDPGSRIEPGFIKHNLRQQVTSFVGREQQIAKIKAFLANSRLVTLTGMGGSGKTRLSLQVADDLIDSFPDGVWQVKLDALSNPAFVSQALASVLGVTETPGETIQQSIVNRLRAKHLLLILDNCEHLITACASLAAELLGSCPDVHILATSRERLNVAGEQNCRIPLLSIPDLKKSQTPEAVSQYDAVRLFTQRAQNVQPSFAVTDQNALTVAQVCVRLEGIPLAIELAAARVASVPVEQINIRLSQRFSLLTGGLRDTLPRQQTLRALIDWSYDLLNAKEKALLCRLSVFAGGWTLEAAETVCGGGHVSHWEVMDLVTALVDKSLVAYGDGGGSTDRYRLLETVRDYAADRLKEGQDTSAMQDRHLQWYLRLAEVANSKMTGPDQAIWLYYLENEHDNLRSALTWCEQEQTIDNGLRLTAALGQFWSVCGYWSEGRHWFDTMFARIRGATPTKRWSMALVRAGIYATFQFDYTEAKHLYENILEISRTMGDQQGISVTLHELGMVAQNQGEYTEAKRLYEESLEIKRTLGDQQNISSILHQLGTMARSQGEYTEAKRLYEKSLEIKRTSGDQQNIADTLYGLGRVVQSQGEYAEAKRLYEKSLEIFRTLGDQRSISTTLLGLGNVAQDQFHYEEAKRLYEESFDISCMLGYQQNISIALHKLGNVARSQGENTEAMCLYIVSLEIFRTLGDQQSISANLDELGNVAQDQFHYEEAKRLYEESLAIKRTLGDQQGISITLYSLGTVAQSQGEYAEAKRLYEKSLEISRTMGDQQGISVILLGQGRVARSQGEYAEAKRLYEKSLEIKRTLGDQQDIADTLYGLGSVATLQSDYAEAKRLYEESLEIERKLGCQRDIAVTLHELGTVARSQRDYSQAKRLYEESLAIDRTLGNQRNIAITLHALGIVAQEQEQAARASYLGGASEALLEATSEPINLPWRSFYNIPRPSLSPIKETLSNAWDAGRMMTIELAVDYALSQPD